MTPLVLGLGVPELLIILAVVLLLFGGARLAGLGKSNRRSTQDLGQLRQPAPSTSRRRRPATQRSRRAAPPTSSRRGPTKILPVLTCATTPDPKP
jgi:sec-independent protein translocase protein TatA